MGVGQFKHITAFDVQSPLRGGQGFKNLVYNHYRKALSWTLRSSVWILERRRRL